MFVSKATILHADLDAFYASVEQRDNPKLRGKPVIVGMGVVLACSYEAKARGVKTAKGGHRAKRLCPEAIVVPPRMKAYTAASRAICSGVPAIRSIPRASRNASSIDSASTCGEVSSKTANTSRLAWV